MLPHQSPTETVRILQERLRQLEQSRKFSRKPHRFASLSTGIDAFDRLLPAGGVEPATLLEWLAEGAGSGAGTLALNVASLLVHSRDALVVIDGQRHFYPPAAARMGIELGNTIVVQPRNPKETLWTLEQSLRCSGVAVVVCWIDHLDPVSFRRLQLAAEAGGGVGLLLRAAQVQRSPSWADVRLLVQPVPVVNSPAESLGRRLRITRLSCRGGHSGGNLVVDIDDEGSVREVPKLVPAADMERAAGA